MRGEGVTSSMLMLATSLGSSPNNCVTDMINLSCACVCQFFFASLHLLHLYPFYLRPSSPSPLTPSPFALHLPSPFCLRRSPSFHPRPSFALCCPFAPSPL